jgi:hypothetical protein
LEVRAANDRIAEKAEQLRFVSRVPMICECGDPDCRSLVLISLEAYRAIGNPYDTLTASGHEADRTDLLRETPDYDIRRANSNRGNGHGRFA